MSIRFSLCTRKITKQPFSLQFSWYFISGRQFRPGDTRTSEGAPAGSKPGHQGSSAGLPERAQLGLQAELLDAVGGVCWGALLMTAFADNDRLTFCDYKHLVCPCALG